MLLILRTPSAGTGRSEAAGLAGFAAFVPCRRIETSWWLALKAGLAGWFGSGEVLRNAVVLSSSNDHVQMERRDPAQEMTLKFSFS